MSDNKFILQLKGQQTPKSVVEIKNDKLVAPFVNVSNSSDAVGSIIPDKDSSVVVAKGAENWQLDGGALVPATNLTGNGADYTGEYAVSGNMLWVNSTYTFSDTKIFTPSTKWVLQLCGKNLNAENSNTIDFSFIVKIGSAHIMTKTVTVSEQANFFCKRFVLDFSESIQTAIKAEKNTNLVVQLLCADATASATIYNGMTTLTALQRRVDGDAVASDTKTFEELEEISDAHISNKNNPHEVTKAQVGLGNCDNTSDLDKPISTATQTALNGKVSTDGSSTMTGVLKMRATESFKCAIAPCWDGVGLYKLNDNDSVTLLASMDTPDGWVPGVNNTYNMGSSLKKWKDLYLSGTAYIAKINNGYDLLVPAKSGTLATKEEVDLAANSGRMILDQGVWYAKMYAATVAPAAENGTNYADFSQVDGQGNPIIVTYNRVNGAWVQDQTITPPTDYDGYVAITAKIWDIVEQAGQQGGRILWNHQSKEFTPYPQIISFEDAALTGTPTAPTLNASSPSNQIVNKQTLENALVNHGTGRNVGDVFFTMRNDNELNGAVECNGATYNTTDFTGAQSIGALLANDKVPYVSLSQYATLLSTQGSVGVFGWDGGSTTEFRVPNLNDVFVETGAAAQIGYYLPAGLPNITGAQPQVAVVRDSGTGSGALHTSGDTEIGYTGGGSADRYLTARTLNLTASEDNSVFGNSNTVQPSAVRYRAMVQLAISASDSALEVCTSVLSDVANLKDGTNFTQTGRNIANWSSNITNCITEIPEDIKLSIDNSYGLVLAAGSVVYRGGGTQININNDISFSAFATFPTTDFVICVNTAGTSFLQATLSNTASAATNPGTAHTIWYNTTDRKCYLNNANGDVSVECSLPIAIVRHTNGTGWTRITQAFNGFGYVGTRVFALPGVKFLVPNGRNDDGTLKSTTVTLAALLTTGAYNSRYLLTGSLMEAAYYTNYAEQETQPSFSNGIWYRPSENKMFKINNGAITDYPATMIGRVNVLNQKISSIDFKRAFQAVDMSNSGVVIDEMLPTADNNYRWYRKYRNGWIVQGGYIARGAAESNTVTFSVPMADTNYSVSVTGDWTSYTDRTPAADRATATTTGISLIKDGSGMGLWWEIKGLAAY